MGHINRKLDLRNPDPNDPTQPQPPNDPIDPPPGDPINPPIKDDRASKNKLIS